MSAAELPSRHITHEDAAWQLHAACAGLDADMFYPQREHGGGADMAAAKAVCDGCPVRVPCLEYALMNDEKYGVWGGKSERQRRRMRAAIRKGLEVVL